jgi:hypothetical protein
VTVGPVDEGDQVIRSFWNPTPFSANPGAKYKVLVNGRSGGFRHHRRLPHVRLIGSFLPVCCESPAVV